jgi:hypothetical protein
MPRRSYFFDAVLGNSGKTIAAAATQKSPKLPGQGGVQKAHDGGEIGGIPAPTGLSIATETPGAPPENATDAQIAAWRVRWGADFGNVKSLAGGDPQSALINPFTLFAQVWRPLVTDRPLIIRVHTVMSGLVLYAPRSVPANTVHAQRSQGPGIVYLPTPGQWWLYYDGTAGTTVDCTAIDATDPAVAVRYLSEQGAAYWSNTIVEAPSSTVSSVQLVDFNRDRRGLILQNIDGTNAVAIRQVATGTPTLGLIAGSSSFRLAAGGELFLTGEQASRQRYVVQSTAAAPVLVTVQQMF